MAYPNMSALPREERFFVPEVVLTSLEHGTNLAGAAIVSTIAITTSESLDDREGR